MKVLKGTLIRGKLGPQRAQGVHRGPQVTSFRVSYVRLVCQQPTYQVAEALDAVIAAVSCKFFD